MTHTNTRPGCIFCEKPMDERLFTLKHAFACLDLHPVAPGHILVIPARHEASWFGLNRREQEAMLEILDRAREYLDVRYSPDGYTIGVNEGAAAGQTVFHVHLHLIPRYANDVDDPRGGIRGVLPGKQHYPIHTPDD